MMMGVVRERIVDKSKEKKWKGRGGKRRKGEEMGRK